MGLIYNVSRDGMFVVNGAGFNVERYVTISMPQITLEQEPIQVSGLVIHRNNVGFGVMFARVDQSTRGLIAKLAERRCSV
ncbi:hypothetical protein Tel_13135 [Candidatus Tenderia electrophaga]|uniref:PilZ domain-containing protein n=1 Tax=Candidatus Tenderia electrophaga TaxID=1748243 RepID=A0A0S2TFS1_9GAMM|nr:hypothetical protein Tel_13135 [Candidatus Tenderia electrophaga]